MLPIRGVLYTLTTSVPLLVGIQVLDGVANAIFGVVSVLVIADLTRGTGRFNITQGGLATAVGIGASVSTTFAGYLVQRYGYSVSFLGLGWWWWRGSCFGLACPRRSHGMRCGLLCQLEALAWDKTTNALWSVSSADGSEHGFVNQLSVPAISLQFRPSVAIICREWRSKHGVQV